MSEFVDFHLKKKKIRIKLSFFLFCWYFSVDVSGGMGCRPVFGRREAAMLSIGLLAGAIWNASENEVAVASEFTDSNFLCPSFGSVRIMESTK